MNSRRRGLGNLGVDVLLSAVSRTEDEASGELRRLAIETIRRGRYQPRIHIKPEALEELAASIRAQGVVQPIVVRPLDDPSDEQFELIAGERRWRAAQMAGLEHIPAVVKPIPDQAAAAMALIENIQREDLNPLEEAGAFSRLIEEFGLTHGQVAETVGCSRAAVSNLLRLLELPEEIKRLLHEGELEMGHARALLSLKGSSQLQAARRVVARRLTVRETERLVQNLLADKPASPPRPGRDPDVHRLEQSLSDKLGARVAIQHNRGGKGKLTIHYTSLDELDGILERIH